jgi:hypothetical protein
LRVEALMTLSVMSTRGPANTRSCRIRSYFSVSKICLMTLLARSTTAASSSFLRWFRSSWNSRRLRWISRSWSTSSRWRRLRSASASVGRVLVELVGGGLQAARRSSSSFSRLRTRLRAWPARLGRRCIAQHAVAVDVADLQFLRLRAAARQASSAAPAASRRVSLERGPDLELKSLDSIAGCLRIGVP